MRGLRLLERDQLPKALPGSTSLKAVADLDKLLDDEDLARSAVYQQTFTIGSQSNPSAVGFASLDVFIAYYKGQLPGFQAELLNYDVDELWLDAISPGGKIDSLLQQIEAFDYRQLEAQKH